MLKVVNFDIFGWVGIFIVFLVMLIICLLGYKVVYFYEWYVWILCFVVFFVVMGVFIKFGEFDSFLFLVMGLSERGVVFLYIGVVFGFVVGWLVYLVDYSVY